MPRRSHAHGRHASRSLRRPSALPACGIEVFETRSLLSLTSPFELTSVDGVNGFKLEGQTTFDDTGATLSTAGDVNNDGLDDFIVGAPGYDPAAGREQAGAAYVVFGTAAGRPAVSSLTALNGTNGFRINGALIFDDLGVAVSAAGDFNGDGIDDLIVGAELVDGPATNGNAGAAYVIYGKTGTFASTIEVSALTPSTGFVIKGIATNDFGGISVGKAGDFNGDGRDDVIVGASQATPVGSPNPFTGVTYVVFGRATGTAGQDLAAINGTNGVAINGNVTFDAVGDEAAGIGDMNNDGLDDIIIGARTADPGGRDAAGSAFVVFGRASGMANGISLSSLNGTNGFRINGIAAGDQAATHVAAIGDVNNDGIPDVALSAPSAAPGGVTGKGQAYVVFGKRTGLAATLELSALNGTNGFRMDGITESDALGTGLGGVGDFNGDGIDDFVVAANFVDFGIPRTNAGQTYLVFGKSGSFGSVFNLAGLNGTNGVTINGVTFNDNSGDAASGIGDVNGDGRADLAIGATGVQVGTSAFVGAAYILYGGTVANDAPVITSLGGNVGYTENGAAKILTTTANVLDTDSLDFFGGNLTVQLSANSVATDQLGIRNQGTGAGQIGVSGSTVTFGGQTLGTFTGGTGSTPLVVSLTSGIANAASVQALVRNITFRNPSDNPLTRNRTVTFRVNDGDGGTSAIVSKLVVVTAANDAPVVGNLGATTVYTAGSAAVPVSPAITVTDADSSNLNTGKLIVQITQNANSFDRLAITNQGTANGQIGVSGANVTFGGVVIGTFSGGAGATALQVTFNSNTATAAAAQALARAITYRSATASPPIGNRTVSFQVLDGDGGTSTAVTKTVQVAPANAAPVLGGLGGTVAYTAGSAPVIISSTGTVTDSNSANFNGGQLTVRITQNANSFDRLSIVNQGTGAGQIGVSGSNVTFGGVTIGTFTGGAGSTALVITFNSNSATVAAVQALVRRIAYRSATGAPPTATRTVSFQVSDGDGGTSAAVAKSITVSAAFASPSSIAASATDYGSPFAAYDDWRDGV